MLICRPGDTVFYNNPHHSWILGSVTEVSKKDETASVQAVDPKRNVTGEITAKVPARDICSVMATVIDEDVEDLLSLTVLHDATLLRCLFLRYMNDHIYTNIGAIVVAFNPFTFDIPWYKDDQMANYLAEGDRVERNLPHSWAVAHNTYFELVNGKCPQCILVSGESGSGKTEAAKIVVKYLAALSKKRAATEEETLQCEGVGVKMQQCSPILECFGNARTVRNDNSSRFGKFMKIQFSSSGVLCGSRTTRYLLEKSRIITAARKERLYHSFYVIFRSPEMAKKKLGLGEDRSYRSVSSGGLLTNGDFDTEEDFEQVCAAMRTVGLSDSDVVASWAVPAGIVTMLNVSLVSDNEGSSVDPSTSHFLKRAAELWHISDVELQKELLQSEIHVKDETTRKLHNVAQAIDARDALCKALYDGLFEWLVDKCNNMCDAWGSQEGRGMKGVAGGGSAAVDWIGLLDIFGFEDFEVNSFEQLCINLANESLQGHYNAYVFEKDMDECRVEGIDVADIRPPSNKACLALISSNGGILSLLDDQCSLGKGTDLGFLESLIQHHGAHPDFIAPRFVRAMTFRAKHYAGDVLYDVTNWLEKNRDTLKDSLKTLVRSSRDSVIRQLIAPPLADAHKKRGRLPTVGAVFRQQLLELLEIINCSNPHWIRCIKPHPAKKPRMFDGLSVTSQLESSGVLGTVKIRKAGYPVRIPFDKFVDRFFIFTKYDPKRGLRTVSPKDYRAVCLKFLDFGGTADKAHAQAGKTKMFLKAEALTALERKRSDINHAYYVTIQSHGRAFMERRLKLARFRYAAACNTVGRAFKGYMRRTAKEREARRHWKEMLAAKLTEGTSCALADFTSAAQQDFAAARREIVSAAAQWFHELPQVAFDWLIGVESKARQSIEDGFVVYFIQDKETRRRQLLEAGCSERLYLLRVDCAEEAVFRLQTDVLARTRSETESQWNSELLNGPLWRAALQMHCRTEEAHRSALEAGYRTDRMELVATFSKPQLKRIEAAQFHSRWDIAQGESVRRRHLLDFERHYVYTSLLCELQALQGKERHYLSVRWEPRERAELQEAFLLARGLVDIARDQRNLIETEREARIELVRLEIGARGLLHGSSRNGINFVLTASLEQQELTQRAAIVNTERKVLSLAIGSEPTPDTFAGLSELQRQESHWRRRLEALIDNVHYATITIHGCSIVYLLREAFCRRLMFLLCHLGMQEIAERRHVEEVQNERRANVLTQALRGLQSLDERASDAAHAAFRKQVHSALLQSCDWGEIISPSRSRKEAERRDKISSSTPQQHNGDPLREAQDNYYVRHRFSPHCSLYKEPWESVAGDQKQ